MSGSGDTGRETQTNLMTLKELERAREWLHTRGDWVDGADKVSTLAAYGAEIERAAVEKACKAMCENCDLNLPLDQFGLFHSRPGQLKQFRCAAYPLRAAFSHLAAKTEGR